MKRILAAAFLMFSASAFAQVTITAPYEYGQTLVKVAVKYPATIVKADSASLEVSYDGGDYAAVKTKVGKPVEFTHGYNHKRRFDKNRKYRVVVYQKGKEPVISNEAELRFDPEFAYTETGLPSVTNVKAVLVEKDGQTYVRVTWTAVPNAFGYRLFTANASGELIWEGELGDGGYLYTTTVDYLVYTQSERTYTFAVGALEGPNDNNDFPKLVNKVTIKVPMK